MLLVFWYFSTLLVFCIFILKILKFCSQVYLGIAPAACREAIEAANETVLLGVHWNDEEAIARAAEAPT